MFVAAGASPALAVECPAAAAELAGLIGRGSIRLELEPAPFEAGTLVYDYLLDDLAAAAALARGLGLADYRIEPEAGGVFRLRDRDRFDAVFSRVARGQGLAAYMGSGRYQGRLLGSVSGRALVVICYAALEEGGEGPRTANRLEVLMRFDNPFLHVLGRVFGAVFRGRLEAVMERPVRTARRAAEAVQSSPALVYLGIEDFEGLSPEMLERFRTRFDLPR